MTPWIPTQTPDFSALDEAADSLAEEFLTGSTPEEIFAFFSIWGDYRSSRTISWLTDGPWSHCGLVFKMEGGAMCYFEAIPNGGFQGPRPLWKLTRAVMEDDRRRNVIVPLHLDRAAVGAKWHVCLNLRGHRSYASLQLLAMAAFERYGIPVPTSPRRVVCSEILSRILAPEIDLRDARRTKHDEVNPNSAWRRLLEIMAGYGYVNAPPLPQTA